MCSVFSTFIEKNLNSPKLNKHRFARFGCNPNRPELFPKNHVLFSYSPPTNSASLILSDIICSYIMIVSSFVVMELILQLLRQTDVRKIFLIGTFPCEMVLAWVVADREAARWVWFNWWKDTLKTNIHKRTVIKEAEEYFYLNLYLCFVFFLWKQPVCSLLFNTGM